MGWRPNLLKLAILSGVPDSDGIFVFFYNKKKKEFQFSIVKRVILMYCESKKEKYIWIFF